MDRLTIPEYNLLMEVYTKFKKFYDYEKEVAKATKKSTGKSRFSDLYKALKKGELEHGR